MPQVQFDTFYRYDDLTAILQGFAGEFASICSVDSIGKSYEGRDIWIVTISNGPHDEKPALWVEANIHAMEVTGSTAALHLISRLCTGYGKDDKVTRAVDTRTFYVVPRLNPDGAELALGDRPRFVRSSVRPWPRTDLQDGLVDEDVDADGRILSMRIADANGTWKLHPAQPRLLVPRDPDEDGGSYYRLLPEGTIRNYDGVMIPFAPALEGLDLNRNWPAEWRTEGEQRGAGPYPTSEPEIRAEVQAIVDRPNVCGYISYHTFSGVHLRPYSAHADDHFPSFDLRVYKAIGEKATSITGYRAVSVFHDFKYDLKDVISGVSDDWMYDHLGIYAWTTEFWSPMQQAGIEDFKYIEWFWDHPVEDDLKLLKWNDETLGGKGFVDWYPFEHPQLGKVELGGWDVMYCWGNPPPEKLEAEIAPHSDLAIYHALISPKLELRFAEATSVGDGVWRIRFVVQNTGWLPTNVTEKANERKVVRPLEARIELPEGASLVSGVEKVELGQLTGRALKTSISPSAGDATTDWAKAEWVVRAPAGTTVSVEARHQRAGVVGAELTL